MMDLHTLANGAIELFRHHSPWLAGTLAKAAVTQSVREAWEQVKKKLSSPGGAEAVTNVEGQPEKQRNWVLLAHHLQDAIEQVDAFRESLERLIDVAGVRQSITGDRNKQAAITGSPGAKIQM